MPSPTNISPSAKTAVAVIALVPLPNKIPPSVRVVAPVPPEPTGNVPDTSVAKATFAQALVPVPLPLKTLLAVGVLAPVPTFVSNATTAVSVVPCKLECTLFAFPSPSNSTPDRPEATGKLVVVSKLVGKSDVPAVMYYSYVILLVGSIIPDSILEICDAACFASKSSIPK